MNERPPRPAGMICLIGSLSRGAHMSDNGESDAAHEELGPSPRAKLMEEVAKQMDAIEADFGDDYEIGNLITIVEIARPDGETGIRVRSTGPQLVSLGMLRIAENILVS
jgi:hypothetical protein